MKHKIELKGTVYTLLKSQSRSGEIGRKFIEISNN